MSLRFRLHRKDVEHNSLLLDALTGEGISPETLEDLLLPQIGHPGAPVRMIR